jgi:hypothetical protein
MQSQAWAFLRQDLHQDIRGAFALWPASASAALHGIEFVSAAIPGLIVVAPDPATGLECRCESPVYAAPGQPATGSRARLRYVGR